VSLGRNLDFAKEFPSVWTYFLQSKLDFVAATTNKFTVFEMFRKYAILACPKRDTLTRGGVKK
jgi:hypothetical protein